MIEVPRDATLVQERRLDGSWWPTTWGRFNKYLLPSDDERAWTNPVVRCWLLTHPTGVYIVWNKALNRPNKHYENEETAKIAVELQV